MSLFQAVVKLNAPPNTPVFTLQSKDPDTDHNLHYFLVRDRSKTTPPHLSSNLVSLQPGDGSRWTRGAGW